MQYNFSDLSSLVSATNQNTRDHEVFLPMKAKKSKRQCEILDLADKVLFEGSVKDCIIYLKGINKVVSILPPRKQEQTSMFSESDRGK